MAYRDSYYGLSGGLGALRGGLAVPGVAGLPGGGLPGMPGCIGVDCGAPGAPGWNCAGPGGGTPGPGKAPGGVPSICTLASLPSSTVILALSRSFFTNSSIDDCRLSR